MSQKKFLIRLDDCHKNQNYGNWNKIISILEKHNIIPLVAVIPKNKDISIAFSKNTEDEFVTWLSHNKERIELGVHGFNHVFHKSSSSLFKAKNTSEFSDLPYAHQLRIMQDSIAWFNAKNYYPNWFVAPRHSFDKTTIEVCKLLDLSISDGTDINLFKYRGVIFVPQLYNKARVPLFSGVYTFCYHPNLMSDNDFVELDFFLKEHSASFIEWRAIKNMKVKGTYLRSQLVNNIWIIRNYVWNTFFKKHRS